MAHRHAHGLVPVIVYGDPQYEETLGALLGRFNDLLAVLRDDIGSTDRSSRVCRSAGLEQLRLSTRTDAAQARHSHQISSPSLLTRLDELRALLIHAGQLEQAVYDSLSAEALDRVGERFRCITDQAAAAFCACWASTNDPKLTEMLRHLTQLVLVDAAAELNTRLTVKLPEGFAFYALYPDQYCLAALRWLADHENGSPRRAAVVGIRTIGTTLSAVVGAVLAAAGWEVRRATVRPSGHPYSRQVEIARDELGEAEWGLIVDEGPGQSGSSMASTAAALAAHGIDPAHISFLPSHDAGPSGAAPEDSRAWWSRTRCYAVPLRELRWEGRALTEALATQTVEILPESGPVDEVRDMAGGLWREVVYPNVTRWPAVDGPFERTKYRCTLRDGTSVLWKFAGQVSAPAGPGSADEHALALLTERAEAGWTAAPLGAALGFVALPWVEGTPLVREDASAVVLDHMGRYLFHVAGPPLSGAEREAARTRLREMLYWNTWEALGEETAERTRMWSERAVELEGEASLLSYGDGRMAPHEWLRLPCGRLLKTDCIGHQWDHTAVGRQPLAWDLAGALVEWGLEGEAALPLLAAVQQASGPAYPPDLLTFYRMAYAAFRVGMTSLCAQMCPHYPEEQERLWRAHARYREELAARLSPD